MKNITTSCTGAERKKLHQLFFPLFFELLFMMLTGIVDTLMLSSVGDHAVGGAGTATTYIGLFIMMFSIISSGMVAVMTQYIGADRPGVARQALKIGLLFNLAIGAAATVILVLGAEPILNAVGIAENLREPSKIYLQTVGMFCLCDALSPIVSSYLRSFGYTAPSFAATLSANVLNAGLNMFFLFVMNWGVFGVALATGISKVVSLSIISVSAKLLIKQAKDNNPPPNKEIFGKIIKVGLPAAVETILYNFSITLVISMLNRMDSTGVQATARAYALQITNFSYCASTALAEANAILVGWHLGAGEHDKCIRSTRKAAILGIIASVIAAGAFAIFHRQIVGLLTDSSEMIRLVGLLLAIDIVLEIGRSTNLIYGAALKSSGDSISPMVIAAIFMFLCAVGGTWLFGLKLGFMAVGAYIGMALDECIRAIFMCGRWRGGRWKKMGFATKE